MHFCGGGKFDCTYRVFGRLEIQVAELCVGVADRVDGATFHILYAKIYRRVRYDDLADFPAWRTLAGVGNFVDIFPFLDF